MRKNRHKKKKFITKKIVGGVLLFIAVIGFFLLKNKPTNAPSPDKKPAEQVENHDVKEEVVEQKQPEQPAQTNWPVQLTDEQAASLTVVVNKKHKLPSSYVPNLVAVAGGQLRPEAASALQRLLSDAEAAGFSMKNISSYRSYQNQVSTYQYWVNTQGQAEADRGSARPGHSEHQTGLAIDLGNPDGSCELDACFGSSLAGKWLSAHASEYGFIIRYPEGKESLTGYQYEPWHLRFVGTEIAKAIISSGQTLDQYFNIEAGGY